MSDILRRPDWQQHRKVHSSKLDVEGRSLPLPAESHFLLIALASRLLSDLPCAEHVSSSGMSLRTGFLYVWALLHTPLPYIRYLATGFSTNWCWQQASNPLPTDYKLALFLDFSFTL